MKPDRTRYPDHTLQTARPRRGSILVEAGVAGVLLITILGMLVPVLARTAERRQQVDRRELAQGVVGNFLEQVSLVPEPTRETLQPIADQLTASLELPSPTWQIVVTPEQNPAMNRVEATLSWQARPLVRQSVTLVRWYRGGTP